MPEICSTVVTFIFLTKTFSENNCAPMCKSNSSKRSATCKFFYRFARLKLEGLIVLIDVFAKLVWLEN